MLKVRKEKVFQATGQMLGLKCFKQAQGSQFKMVTKEDPELTSSHRHTESIATYRMISPGGKNVK